MTTEELKAGLVAALALVDEVIELREKVKELEEKGAVVNADEAVAEVIDGLLKTVKAQNDALDNAQERIESVNSQMSDIQSAVRSVTDAANEMENCSTDEAEDIDAPDTEDAIDAATELLKALRPAAK